MINVNDLSLVSENLISEDLFGGNLLAPRGSLLGEGSYSEAISELGVYGLRYPGGSLTEYMFDITDPNATELIDERTGEAETTIGLSDFLNYAETAAHPVTIVVPTRTQLSDEVDENGDRIPDIDEDDLRSFISDVASGEYGNADISAFEIGNEYWGSGEMNALEYGRLAAEMASIIDSELTAAGAGEIDILVQKGNSFGYSDINDDYEGVPTADVFEDLNSKYKLDLGEEALYSSGDINWTHIASRLVLDGFEESDNISTVDGIVTHIYSYGDKAPATRFLDLNQANEVWISKYPDLELHITEWNLKSTPGLDEHDDYGLFQAHEMLNIMEEFIRTGVDNAHVWPLIQSSKSALSVGPGHEFESTTAAGEMFFLMAETLPGKFLVDLSPDSRETESHLGEISVHMYAGENELALFIVNESREDSLSSRIDLSNFIQGFEQADIVVLGVEHGEAPGSNDSRPFVEEVDPSVIDRGQIEASLDPGEVMQIVLSDVIPTEQFAQIWEQANAIEPVEEYFDQDKYEPLSDEPLFDESEFPVVDFPDIVFDEEEEDNTIVDDVSGGMEWLFGLLGILALGAAMGGM